MFKFSEEVFLEGQEMLILVTELTINPYSAHFISRYGCKEYFAHNKELLFYERQQEIIQELEVLGLELKLVTFKLVSYPNSKVNMNNIFAAKKNTIYQNTVKQLINYKV